MKSRPTSRRIRIAKELKGWKTLYDTACGNNSDKEIAFARRLPAAYIDYSTARKYAASVQGLLPTEAEWEYAARSRGQTNVFSWGPDPAPIDDPKANLDNPRNLGKLAKPQAVDSFLEDATAQHVIGMTGNVQELCADIYKPYANCTQINIRRQIRTSIVAMRLYPRMSTRSS